MSFRKDEGDKDARSHAEYRGVKTGLSLAGDLETVGASK
jgi:hypothetical protein